MPKNKKTNSDKDNKQSSITTFFSVTKSRKKNDALKKDGKENDKTIISTRSKISYPQKKHHRSLILDENDNTVNSDDDDGDIENIEKKNTGDDSSTIDPPGSQLDVSDSDDDTLSLCLEDEDDEDVDVDDDDDTCQLSDDDDDDDEMCQWSESKKKKIRSQIEYYLSDDNMKQDKFYRAKIISSPFGDGWFDLGYILTAPRLSALVVPPADYVSVLQSSTSVEIKKDVTDPYNRTYLIRRTNNRKLPKFVSHRTPKKRRRSNNYDSDDSDYGFNDSKGDTRYNGNKVWPAVYDW